MCRLKRYAIKVLCTCLAILPAMTLAAFAQPGPAPAKPTIYEFGRPDCPICQKVRGLLKDFQASYPGQVEVRFLSFDADEHLYRRFKIIIVPTLVFLDAGGREVFRHEGLWTREELLKKLKELRFINE